MRILLGVTGSIAAYKAADIVRGLLRRGHEVRVVMTAAACDFITPLTLSTLSRNPVTRPQATPRDWRPEHIENALWCQALLVAPCTANVLAKLALGLADDPLSAAALATQSPIFVAPAMNDGMWENPATQRNLQTLLERGATLIPPSEGDLACGTRGRGRLAPVEEILAHFPAP